MIVEIASAKRGTPLFLLCNQSGHGRSLERSHGRMQIVIYLFLIRDHDTIIQWRFRFVKWQYIGQQSTFVFQRTIFYDCGLRDAGEIIILLEKIMIFRGYVV